MSNADEVHTYSRQAKTINLPIFLFVLGCARAKIKNTLFFIIYQSIKREY